jgi:hypothetical protein
MIHIYWPVNIELKYDHEKYEKIPLKIKERAIMKKIFISMIIIVFVIMSFFVLTLAADMGPKSIDVVLSEIRQEQGINNTDTINVDKVSAAKLEELGDSVMEVMIGNSAMHEQMDTRLGGDGSASLTAFHKKLGYNYLSGYPNGMMNLMSGGMMSTYQGGMMGYFNQGSMMGSFGWGGLVFGFLLLVALIVIVILAIKLTQKQRR